MFYLTSVIKEFHPLSTWLLVLIYFLVQDFPFDIIHFSKHKLFVFQ